MNQQERKRLKDLVWQHTPAEIEGYSLLINDLLDTLTDEQLADYVERYPVEEELFDCDECGEPFRMNPDGTTQHVTEDGEVDFDADNDHTPYEAD